MSLDHSMFLYTKVTSEKDLPPRSRSIIDVIVLDMNFGVPNLGHDSLVHAVHECGRAIELGSDCEVRVLSVDVRRSGWVPPFDPDRFRLYIGTGGPGHLDPDQNDGLSEWSEGVSEEADWEPALFDLFEKIVADERVALFAFCHSFGVMCRWAGIADPKLRSEEKGKSSGIVGYRLSEEALEHPWFSKFERELVKSPFFRVLDSRLFDLMPSEGFRDKVIPLAWEATEDESHPVLTMVEFARDPGGEVPRVLAANHHPEVVDLEHLQAVLDEKLESGEVDEEWYAHRGESLRAFWDEPDTDIRVRRTARYTLLEPLRFNLEKIAAARGRI